MVAASDKDQIIAQLTATVSEMSSSIERLTAEVSELKRMLFGQSRERLQREKLPPLARAMQDRQPPDEAQKLARRLATKEKRALRALAKKALPTEDVIHPIDACPHCASAELKDIGSSEISEEIDLVPAHFVRRRHIRPKKKCQACERIVCAPAPARVTDGALWGPRLHAHVAVAKCADALPFYRLAKRFQRDGIPIERSTLDRLFHRDAELLAPIAARILALAVQSERVNADETPVFVQAPDRCKRGYMWTFLSDKNIAFVFSPNRSGETPKRVLAGTTGFLQVDQYTGYNAVCVPKGRQRVGCLSHSRRKFFRALDSAPEDAACALDHVLALYEVEYEAARRGILGTDEHLALRRAITAERFDAFIAWVNEKKATYPPKSPMGMALRYAHKTLVSLQAAVLADPRVRLDNNLAENALRLIALGRKNFLFVGDDEAGHNLAALQTVVSTCIANDVNPEAYIADVLMRLGNTPSSRIDELLPASWSTAAQATTSAQAS